MFTNFIRKLFIGYFTTEKVNMFRNNDIFYLILKTPKKITKEKICYKI